MPQPAAEGGSAPANDFKSAGIKESVTQIMARARARDAEPHKDRRFILRRHRGSELGGTVEFPIYSGTNATGGSPATSLQIAQPGPFGTNGTPLAFTGATLSDTGSYPPDTMGAVGPSQFIVAVNGRIRTFNKATGLADGVLNSSMDAFFNSVMTPPANNNFTSDPRIRYDRLSGRWFVLIIDVPGQTGALPNRVLLAVSSASVITAGTTWSFYYFQHDLVSPTGDTGEFADYPTLGIDANALYIGVNIFTSSGGFDNTTAFVVRKSSLLTGGPIVVTAFRRLITGFTGPYTPQGVDNFDPNATEGFLIGIDYSNSARLRLRRISGPGGTPTISGNVSITVSSFAGPLLVPSSGTSSTLDGLDTRLLAAHYRNGSLWTSQNVGVNSSGGTSSPTRNGVRWYKLGGIPTGQTPVVQQSGTIYDSSSTNIYYWMGTVMVSGQGHAVAGFSSSSTSQFVAASVAGRLTNDIAGTFGPPIIYSPGAAVYNPPYNRWGDYSYTCVDPNDDMTIWTIQQNVNAANSYAVQIGKIAAPPPALPFSCSPSVVTQGVAGINVTLLGSSSSGSGFYDPGTGFSNRLAAVVNGGGVVLNSLTYINPTSVTLNLTISNTAAATARTISVINPDGQTNTSAVAVLTIESNTQPPVITVPPVSQIVQCGSNASFTVTATGSSPLNYQWSSNGVPVIGATNTSLTFISVRLSGFTVAVVVTNSLGSATNSATLTVQDTLAPVITLNGLGLMTNELGSAFTDPGATANDLCAGVVPVTTNGAVNVNVVGTNTLTYKAGDGNGNTNTATRIVIVRDTVPPAISWSFTNLVLVADTNCVALMPDATGTNYILATDFSGALTITQAPTNTAALLLGTNVVVLTVADASGNKSFSTNRIVVRDQTPPLLALNGASRLTNELGAAFTDPGVMFSDACSGIVSVTTNGSVNVGVIGTNTLAYTATDASGNTNAVTRTVIVRDTTPPEISWSFTNLVLAADTNCSVTMPDVTGTNFILATDLSGALTITQSPMNGVILPLGTNLVVITVNDASSNAAYSTNFVVVRDQTPPVITLTGTSSLVIEFGQAFTEPGATAYDACAGVVPVVFSGTVNTNAVGTNMLTYRASDTSGNTNTAVRTVIVRDTTPPEISWSFTNLVLAADTNCSAAMPAVTGTNFIVATDLSGALTISQSPTNGVILPLGTNLVVITVTDASSNAAASTNFVVVQDQTPPVITLIGGSLLFSELGQVFTDPGATASDACAGVVAVAVSGAVNTNAVGTNTLTYTATDGAGNTNTATRTVIVRDTTPPEISWSFTNLVLAADTNCSAAMPDVTGTNFILATDLSDPLTLIQTPPSGAALMIGTNMVVVAVSDFFNNNAYSTNVLVVQDQTPPVISSQPQSQTNFAGATANFSAGATACTPLGFQWFSNSVVIPEHTNSTLTLSDLSPAAAGDYFVIISAAGGSATSEVATLTVQLRATTVSVVSSANPSGFNATVNFTALMTPTNLTGSIQFFTNGAAFDAAPLVAGQAVSAGLASLPRGTNLIAAVYSGDANHLPSTNQLLQIVTNHPPFAATALFTNTASFYLSIPIADLATNWSDADGDTIVLADVSVSTNGITLTNTGTALVYFNSNNLPDQFVCTLDDGFGGTNFQIVAIVQFTPPDPTPLISSVVVNEDGSFSLNLGGAPGYTYVLEAATNLSPVIDWQPVATNQSVTNGVWQFTDTSATNFPQQFYRLKLEQ